MDLLNIVLIGVALSADAMSVTLGNLLANPKISHLRGLSMPIAFGLFQGIMPTLGYFAGSLAAEFIERYAGIISLAILGFVGGKMIWDGLHDHEGEGSAFSMPVLLLQALATSIDAFAVGVTFVGGSVAILPTVSIIAACTFTLCLLMLFVGRKVGAHFGPRAQIVGGVILVIIGIRSLIA